MADGNKPHTLRVEHCLNGMDEKTVHRLFLGNVAVAALLGSWCVWAIEERWAAHVAEAIVVGTFRPSPSWPWFDGWHIGGEITVHEVLWGREVPRAVRFEVVVPWRLNAEWWPPPGCPEITKEKGLWFLSRSGGQKWSSSIPVSDSGFRPLSSRGYWEDYIRREKRR